MSDDMLERLFGPDPDNTTFPPLNPAKVIPVHDCEWIVHRSSGPMVIACAICGSQRPEAATRGTT